MSKADQGIYAELPEQFTVFRGQDKGDEIKNAWTLDVKIAEGFARGHRGMRNPNPRILTATTEKANVALYHGDREESEVVLFRRPVINFKATRSL